MLLIKLYSRPDFKKPQENDSKSFSYFTHDYLRLSLGSRKEVLCLRSNERHLRAYFETLMTVLQVYRFLLQVAIIRETDLVTKIC